MVDYIFRWLGMQFLPGYREANTPQREEESAEGELGGLRLCKTAGAKSRSVVLRDLSVPNPITVSNGSNGNGKHHNGHSRTELQFDGPAVRSAEFARFQTDAPACDNCGAITVRNGNCYLCHNCGNSMGCS